MKLVLYSGGYTHENETMDRFFQEMLPENPQITYIPACDYQSDVAFREFIERFDHMFHRFVRFPLDTPSKHIVEIEAFNSDVIYLDGGNTFYLLSCLKKSGLMPKLKEFVEKGGILCGQSAGAIVMSPTIATAGMPHFDRDDNHVGLKNMSALGLVKFDLFPHFKSSKRYVDAFLAYSKKSKIPLYACKDGSGIIINNDRTTFVGQHTCFFQGRKFLI